MNILVTGATGFLGSVLCRELERRQHAVVRINSRTCDLRHPESLHQFNDRSFDRLFHLAAWTQAGDFCLHHAGEQWIINQQINTNVLTWWHERQPQAELVTIGSSCVYDPRLELSEENYLVGLPTESLFTYAMTKRMLYAGCLALQQQFGHRFLSVVPSTLYGPDYHTDGRQMHFIFDVIRKIIRAKILGETVTLWGNGQQRRELIHVEDFVSILLRLADLQSSGQPSTLNSQPLESAVREGEAPAEPCFSPMHSSAGASPARFSDRPFDLVNIGAGEEFPIRHFAELVCALVGYDPQLIQYDTSRYVGATSKCLRIDRLKSLIPELRLTPLAEGLKETVDWFLANRERYLT